MIFENAQKLEQDLEVLQQAVAKARADVQRLIRMDANATKYLGGPLSTAQRNAGVATLDVVPVQTAFNMAKATFQATQVVSG